jgi:hypothetical protein
MMRDNKRVTPREPYTTEKHERLTDLHARLAVITRDGGHQALREEIRKVVFDIENLHEGTIKDGVYHLLGKKVTTAIAQLHDVMEILNELRRQGASDT